MKKLFLFLALCAPFALYAKKENTNYGCPIERGIRSLTDVVIEWYTQQEFTPEQKQFFAFYIMYLVEAYSERLFAPVANAQKTFYDAFIERKDIFSDLAQEFIQDAQHSAKLSQKHFNQAAHVLTDAHSPFEKAKGNAIQKKFKKMIEKHAQDYPAKFRNFIIAESLIDLEKEMMKENNSNGK